MWATSTATEERGSVPIQYHNHQPLQRDEYYRPPSNPQSHQSVSTSSNSGSWWSTRDLPTIGCLMPNGEPIQTYQEPTATRLEMLSTSGFSVKLEPSTVCQDTTADYQPMHDTLIHDFFPTSFIGSQPTSVSVSSGDCTSHTYTLGASIGSTAYTLNPLATYYDMPQVQIQPLYQNNQAEPYDLSLNGCQHLTSSVYPSPNYSPPPQDPLVTKIKKRIQAVPCHSNSVCANCQTKETTLWRRNHLGEIECKFHCHGNGHP